MTRKSSISKNLSRSSLSKSAIRLGSPPTENENSMNANFTRLSFASLFLIGFAVNCQSVIGQTWRQSIDLPRLLAERGTIENGSNVVLSLAEADVNRDESITTYLPANTGGLAGHTIIDGSGLNTEGTTSGHATSQANRFLGSGSIANGNTQFVAYDALDYITRVLGTSTGLDPLVQNYDVQSHSWIANFGNGPDEVATAVNALQRLDFTVNRDNILLSVGLNNGTAAHPQLLGQAYNVLAVGRTDGNHSRGETTIYGEGRVRPDVVTLAGSTSAATALTSSVLAVLHDKAITEGNIDARNSEVIKAAVLAGATKREFPDWSRTTTRPLDSQFGAGELNLYNSYQIIEAGEFDGQTTVPSEATIGLVGYDYGESIDPDSPLYYSFEIGPGQEARDLSIILNWNIDVEDLDDSEFFDPSSSLADLSLRLYDSTDSPLGSIIDESLSPVDNTEHIFLSTLGEGLYTIEVSALASTDFALAFFTRSVPEPGSFVVLLAGTALVVSRRRRRA